MDFWYGIDRCKSYSERVEMNVYLSEKCIIYSRCLIIIFRYFADIEHAIPAQLDDSFM